MQTSAGDHPSNPRECQTPHHRGQYKILKNYYDDDPLINIIENYPVSSQADLEFVTGVTGIPVNSFWAWIKFYLEHMLFFCRKFVFLCVQDLDKTITVKC